MVRACALFFCLVLMAGCSASEGSPAPRFVPATRSAAARPVAFGTFEWNADDAIERWKAGTLWPWISAHHVDDILVGFDDAQIAKYSAPAGAHEFKAFVADASGRGVRVELLLGDPHWILPSGTGSLQKIIRRLHALPFAELNLDLEPNEVHGVPMKTVTYDLIAALRKYVASSPWPVELDLNYIYADPSRTGGVCLPCGVQSAGVRDVVLMTYVSRPSLVYRFDAPILAKYPDLRFTIGQSVEPPSVLPPGDSYWAKGFARFYSAMQALNKQFEAQPNYRGITVEAMADLEAMKP